MLLHWFPPTSWLILSWFYSEISALCPSICICRLSEKGRRKVICNRGGMRDPIPTNEMDPSVEILEISATYPDYNSLSISPIFQHLKKLEELRIRNSQLRQIGMHPFWGVPSLRILDFETNKISAVYDYNFRGLVNLVELNLNGNSIESLQNGVFKHLTELRILTLERNLLGELVPRLFLKLGKLHVLKLSGNKFEELNPEVFKDIPELRVLECRRCGLRRINTQIYHLLPYLGHLDLGENQMQFISSDEFYDLKHLRSLKLDGNLLPVVLEKTFIQQHELKYLCLARNRLAKITNTAFLNLSSLVDLDIGYNKLDKIEMVALQHIADTLQRLVISGNQFNLFVIKDILNTVHNVRELDVAQMGLKSIPRGFFPERIRRLNLARNNLTDILFEALPKDLEEINLRDNKITFIDEEIILKFEGMLQVDVAGNPWSCTICDLGALIFRINRSQIFQNLTCVSPKHLQNRVFTSLELKELNSCDDIDPGESLSFNEDKMGLVVGIISLLLFLIVCIIFVICSCMKRRVQNSLQEQKRSAEEHCLEEISFKFPLDLTERKVSISTIDEIKKDTKTLPNGTGI